MNEFTKEELIILQHAIEAVLAYKMGKREKPDSVLTKEDFEQNQYEAAVAQSLLNKITRQLSETTTEPQQWQPIVNGQIADEYGHRTGVRIYDGKMVSFEASNSMGGNIINTKKCKLNLPPNVRICYDMTQGPKVEEVEQERME